MCSQLGPLLAEKKVIGSVNQGRGTGKYDLIERGQVHSGSLSLLTLVSIFRINGKRRTQKGSQWSSFKMSA